MDLAGVWLCPGSSCDHDGVSGYGGLPSVPAAWPVRSTSGCSFRECAPRSSAGSAPVIEGATASRSSFQPVDVKRQSTPHVVPT